MYRTVGPSWDGWTIELTRFGEVKNYMFRYKCDDSIRQVQRFSQYFNLIFKCKITIYFTFSLETFNKSIHNIRVCVRDFAVAISMNNLQKKITR